MKVLQVIPSVSLVHGGPSRAIVDMERALAARSVDVTTVTTNDDGPGRRMTVQCGRPVKAAHATRLFFPLTTEAYKVSIGLVRWLNANVASFDVVHAHALFSFAPIAAALIARRRGVPYILRPLGVLSPYGLSARRVLLKKLSLMLVERRLLAAAAAVHFTSLAEQSEAEALGLKCNGVVVPLGVDVRPVAERGPPCRDSPRILFLSRLDPKKNLDGLLRALPRVLARHPSARLAIAGEGDPSYLGRLKALSHDLGVTDRVDWLGYVEGERKASALAGASVFVLPSYSENFGIAAVEALAAGLPCVVSREVAVAHEVERAGAGVVTGLDAQSIAASIEQVLENKARYLRMSSAAARLAAYGFSLEKMGERLEALYHEIVGAGVE
jgi:glycosyltransferase involved in cell wall biosynthesis